MPVTYDVNLDLTLTGVTTEQIEAFEAAVKSALVLLPAGLFTGLQFTAVVSETPAETAK